MRDHGLRAALSKLPTAELARRLGITRQAISQWDKIPPERVIAVERATGVSRHVLRPDLHPLEHFVATAAAQ